MSTKVREALKTYEEILPAFDRKTFPIDWGNTNGNIGMAHTNIGALEGNVAEFEHGGWASSSRPSSEVTRERAPVFWAKLQNAYGMTQQVIGMMKQDPARLDKAAAAFRLGARSAGARTSMPSNGPRASSCWPRHSPPSPQTRPM